jgi:hypothetical protein
MFEVENGYYETHKDELRKLYQNKNVVIHQDKLFGAYDTLREAFDAAIKELPPETFVIKDLAENDDVPRRFMSRVYV